VLKMTPGIVRATDVTVPVPPLPLAAAVINPLALTVILALVKLPTLALTVASVRAAEPGPAAVPSPVSAVIALGVRPGISAATSARKAGVAAAPVVGPANTVLADCVRNAPVNVPAVVTGLPLTEKTLAGNARATDVTEPPPVPAPAGNSSVPPGG